MSAETWFLVANVSSFIAGGAFVLIVSHVADVIAYRRAQK